jgi:hypothetical protein
MDVVPVNDVARTPSQLCSDESDWVGGNTGCTRAAFMAQVIEGHQQTSIHLAFGGLDTYSHAALTYFESQSLCLTSHIHIRAEISWVRTPSLVLSFLLASLQALAEALLRGWTDA